MVKKIFKNIFIWSLVAVMVAVGLILFIFYGYFEDRIMDTIKSEADMLEAGIEHSGADYFGEFQANGDTRVTWIDSDGTVLHDSKVDKDQMSNHSDREEVSRAMSDGDGEVIRYSETLSQKTMYYARLLDDGTVVRISYGYDTMGGIFSGMVPAIVIVYALLCVVMYIVSKRTSKAIVEPINQIDLESGKMEHEDDYGEIKPLLSRIQRQNLQIDTKVRQLQREHESREKFRRDFTANVSHELKTPLTSISGISEMMMNGIIKEEDIPGFAGNINKEAGRLISLVNDIILISELEGNESYLQKEPVDMVELAKSVRNRVSVDAGMRHISITLKFVDPAGNEYAEDEAVPDIKLNGVYNMLDELMTNLCSNAIKYNRDDGYVHITVKDEGENIQLIIEDSGIGIPDTYKNSIFERFFRVDKSRSKEVGGTGLGLSIVKHVAIFHGGTVKAMDRPEGGTKMVTILPKG